MSDRHMHITGFLRGISGIEQFVEAARALEGGFFAEVIPVESARNGVIAVAFFSKDLDGISDELDMPDVASRLSGILSHDIEIASAWDGPLGGYYWAHSTANVTRYFEFLHYHGIGEVSWTFQPGIMTMTSPRIPMAEPVSAGRLFMRYNWGTLRWAPDK